MPSLPSVSFDEPFVIDFRGIELLQGAMIDDRVGIRLKGILSGEKKVFKSERTARSASDKEVAASAKGRTKAKSEKCIV